MKRILYLIIYLCLFSSCNDGGIVSTESLANEIERGAVLRTIAVNNAEFNVGDSQSTFNVELEEQDLEDGELLEEVEVYVRFLDNTLEGENITTSELLLEVIPAAQWQEGNLGLPRTNLNYTFQELVDVTGITLDEVFCKDQFVIRLNLKLTDGRSFTDTNASSIILAFNTFFSSPFLYTINVVEPIDQTLFTGVYRMESILDGPLGETFVNENGQTFENAQLVDLSAGHSNNTREFTAYHRLHHIGLEMPRIWEFTIACDEVIMGKNQLSSPEGTCIRNAAPLLIGPDTINGPANTNDDTVFELWFVEGYLGFDGGCDFGTSLSRYRFSKQ